MTTHLLLTTALLCQSLMPSGLTVNGVDLDSIFEPRGTSTARANVGIQVAGVDIAQRYYASTGIEDRIAFNTGWQSAGVDLRQLFRRAGYVVAPVITQHPSHLDATVNQGPYYLECRASGLSKTFQWLKQNPSTMVWEPYTSAHAGSESADIDRLVFDAPIGYDAAGNYRCRVSNSGGLVDSIAAVVTVTMPDVITITAQPGPIIANEGDSRSMSVTATGGGNRSYQWYKDGAAVSGATSSTLSFGSISQADEGTYYVIVSGDNGTDPVQSADAQVLVWAALVVTVQPSDITGNSGGAGSTSCTATGEGGVTYRWLKVGNPSFSQWSQTLSFSSLAAGDAGDYYCEVSDTGTGAFRTAYSDTITVTVNEPLAVVGMEHWTGSSWSSGDPTYSNGVGPYAIRCIASGAGTLYFEWFHNGVQITAPSTGNMSATTDQYVWNPVTFADAGTWVCRVSNAYGHTESSITVTVN